MPHTALVTGATGFIGGRLARHLAGAGACVRAMVRERSSAGARGLAELGIDVREADALEQRSLRGICAGVTVAYYLIHSMGRGSRGDFASRERTAARQFASTARQEGVSRIVYLGGLGEDATSEHLRSRHATAHELAEHGPALTYLRAAMVVGAQSESYRTLRYLVQRLPAMIQPAWLANRTQPIAVDDVIAYLAQSGEPGAVRGEVQIGGPDVLSYAQMLDRMALALGVRPRPRLPVPLMTPWLSSLWIGLVTPVDARVARPLIEGLRTATVVTDTRAASGFDVQPLGFDEALRRALAEDQAAAPG